MNKKQKKIRRIINKKIPFNSQKGYTVVELLAVMVILAIIGSVIVGIVSSTLRGAGKATSLNEIRQVGNNRLTGVSKMIEFARSFDGISIDGLTYQDNCIVEFVVPSLAPTEYHYLKVTSFTNNQLIFSCSNDLGTNEPTFASNSASLIDTTTIDVTNCSFTCSQNYLTQPPIIGIYFTLSKKSTGSVIGSALISFETNVTMRNLRR